MTKLNSHFDVWIQLLLEPAFVAGRLVSDELWLSLLPRVFFYQ